MAFVKRKLKNIINRILLSNRHKISETILYNDRISKLSHYMLITENNLEYINDLALNTIYDSKVLATAKGFGNSIKAYNEKVVLLNTEISELADAVKKGLGDEEEGFEVADIIIRACGLYCVFEEINKYRSAKKRFDEYRIIGKINNTCKSDFSDKSLKSKFEDIKRIMESWTIISSCYEMASRGKLDNLYDCSWCNLLILICQCDYYCKKYLDEDVEYFIKEKMKINFSRPYQYGICKEMQGL